MDYALRFFIGGLMSCVRKVSPDCLVPPLLSPWEHSASRLIDMAVTTWPLKAGPWS